jgi:hypothetical protein
MLTQERQDMVFKIAWFIGTHGCRAEQNEDEQGGD